MILLSMRPALEKRLEAYLAWEIEYPMKEEVTLKPKKIVQSVKIFHLKMLAKKVLKRVDICKVIYTNNHVINIKEDKSDINIGLMNE